MFYLIHFLAFFVIWTPKKHVLVDINLYFLLGNEETILKIVD